MNTVLDLLQAKGITAKKVSGHKSGEYHSPCPCDPKSRDRFHVWPEQNEGNVSWWCRSCNTKETLESAGKILVVLDFDKAGLKGWQWWKKNFSNAICWLAPGGMNPGEAFLKG